MLRTFILGPPSLSIRSRSLASIRFDVCRSRRRKEGGLVSSFSESFPRLLPRSSTIVNFAREVTSALPCRASSKKFPTRFVTLPRHNGARDPSLKLPAIQIADSIQRGSGEYTFEKRRFCPRFLSPTRVYAPCMRASTVSSIPSPFNLSNNPRFSNSSSRQIFPLPVFLSPLRKSNQLFFFSSSFLL